MNKGKKMGWAVATLVLLGAALSSKAQVTLKKVGNNPGSISPSAVLEIESTAKGFLPPRMTKAQMRAIANPTEGLIVYETDSKCLRSYSNGSWTGCYITAPSLVSFTSPVSLSSSPNTNQTSFSIPVYVPYTNADGETVPGGSWTSTGTANLTLSLASTQLNTGNGNLTFNVSGTLNGSAGVFTWSFTLLGKSIVINGEVLPFTGD